MSISSICLIIFLIIDPLGKIGSTNKLLSRLKNRQTIILRELVLALAFMMGFNFLGEFLFDLLSISETTVVISSGLILLLASIRILFPAPDAQEVEPIDHDPILVPIAIPGIASPALLATIMIFAKTVPGQLSMVLAILIAWAAAGFMLLVGRQLERAMGNGGLLASERLMAMILMMLSVQRLADGVRLFADNL